MANDCTNRLVVKGPAADVLAFVAAAYGPYDPAWGVTHATEMTVVRAVQAGKDFGEAMADANKRIARLRAAHLSSDADGFTPITASEGISFGTWTRWAGFEIAGNTRFRTSHLSLPSLVPVPADVLAESYDLIGGDWVLEHWGVKWGIGSEAPTVVEEGGVAVATYGSFDSANNAPNDAFLTVSKAWKSLSFVMVSHYSDGGEVAGVALRDGKVLAELMVDEAEFPDPHTPTGEDTSYYEPGPLLAGMVDRTFREVA